IIATNVTRPANSGEWYSASVKRTIATATIAPAIRATIIPVRIRGIVGTAKSARYESSGVWVTGGRYRFRAWGAWQASRQYESDAIQQIANLARDFEVLARLDDKRSDAGARGGEVTVDGLRGVIRGRTDRGAEVGERRNGSLPDQRGVLADA